MSNNSEYSATKFCPYCAEKIQQAAIKCKHCGQSLAEKGFTFESRTDDINEAIQGISNNVLVVLLLGAAFLHVIFSAESPLVFISSSSPINSIAASVSYSIPGMLISILFLVPIANLFIKDNVGKGFFKGFTLKAATIALYIGAVIRLFLFINKFKI